MVATGTVVAGCEPEPTRKKKYKKLHRRGVRREKVFDMGALVCVFIGMGLTWAYIDYRYPGVMPPILPKGNWSFVDRMQNGLAAQTLKRKRKAAGAKRKADREADRELASYCTSQRCAGVLAKDSDFFVLPVPAYLNLDAGGGSTRCAT